MPGDSPARSLYPAGFDTSHIEEIATTEVKFVPRGMSTQARAGWKPRRTLRGQFRPLNTSYQARAPLIDVDDSLQAGMQGQARIYTGWQTIFSRRQPLRCQNVPL